MPVNVDDIIKTLSPKRQEKIAARTIELLAEEMTIRQLRTACNLTQVRLAKALGVNQDSVSRLEHRSDPLMSTLRKAVKAMGGELVVLAQFAGRPAVMLSGLGGNDVSQSARKPAGKPSPTPTAKRRVRA